MIVLQNHTAIGPNIQTVFRGSGGTSPYTYAVLISGAGGTIDGSGVYTAPAIPGSGVDTIQVTDSTLIPVVVTASISILSPLELLCEIIRSEMSLSNDQIYLYNQKIMVPKDNRIFIAVGVASLKPFSNTLKMVNDEEIQSINMKAILSIDIMSKSLDALARKEEVLLALNSTYSQYQQNTNCFGIGRISSQFTNLSSEEGMAIPYRFNISVQMQYYVKKVKAIAYFDTFEDISIKTD